MSETNTKFQIPLSTRKCGAFWVRKQETGKNKISGEITLGGKKINFFGLKNDKDAEHPNSPDYQLFLHEDTYLELNGKAKVVVDKKVVAQKEEVDL